MFVRLCKKGIIMIVDIITIIISVLSLVFSFVTFLITNISKRKNEYIKMYCKMINNDDYYYIINKIENKGIAEKDLKDEIISKKLDMYLSYIEMLLSYSFKLSKTYIFPNNAIISDKPYFSNYICF